MSCTLKHVAAEINADPTLGLKAKVEKSWTSTDTKVAGTRFRRQGRGRKGLKLTVVLVRTGKPVCEVDTSTGYERAADAFRWLSDWRAYDRRYHRAPAPRFNQHFVEGEPRPSRGRVLTYDQLVALKTGDRVWVRVKEHGEDFRRIDGACVLTKEDDNEGRIRTMGQEMPIRFLFGHIDFSSTDLDMPKGFEKLSWDDGENEISLARVVLTPHREKEPS